MKLTTKMRYGTRAMLELALHYGQGPTAAKEIAERQGLSQKYLERLLVELQAGGLVRAIRGARGGYELATPPEAVTLLDIYRALEGAQGFVECTVNPEVCERSDFCVTQGVWAEMYRACMHILEGTTLRDLVQRRHELHCAAMYYI